MARRLAKPAAAAKRALTPATKIASVARNGQFDMTAYLYIAAGGALGSVARYWMAGAIDGRLNAGFPHMAFPWGTVLVNIAGSFAIGIFAAMAAGESRWGLSDSARLFLMVGICGGFTTFSSFSLQTLGLLREGLLLRAGGNVAVSVLVCLAATWAGAALMQALGRPAS
jgi:CrcB protein